MGYSVRRATQREARDCVINHIEFMGSNIYGAWTHKRQEVYDAWDGPRNRTVEKFGHPDGPERGFCYVAFSYRISWPLYVWDVETSKWYGNGDRYSRTTSKHATCLYPHGHEVTYLRRDALVDVIQWGWFEALAYSVKNNIPFSAT